MGRYYHVCSRLPPGDVKRHCVRRGRGPFPWVRVWEGLGQAHKRSLHCPLKGLHGEAEAHRPLEVQGQPALHSAFHPVQPRLRKVTLSQNIILKIFLKKRNYQDDPRMSQLASTAWFSSERESGMLAEAAAVPHLPQQGALWGRGWS